MPSDQSHPFATFPSSAGKGLHGLRPYYTPGLATDNYTSIIGQVPPAVHAAAPPPSYDDYDLIDSRAAARELINYAVLKYLTTAISSPFEVSKTLLQVQYRPYEHATLPTRTKVRSEDDDEEADEEVPPSDDSDMSDADDMDGGPHQRNRRFSAGGTPFQDASLDVDDPAFRRSMPTDATGYIVPASEDDSRRPPHQLRPIDGGVWQGISRLTKQRHEGLRSLFKGQYTNWIYEILHLFLQPTLEGSLNDFFDLYDDTIPLVHLDRAGPNLATLVASNLVVGFLLSPLELIRTRLIVQSSAPLQRKYKGPFHALRVILSEEGGLRGLYLSHNLIPTLLHHTITPLLQNTTPLIIDRVFRISANESPFLYGLAELGLNTLEILISLPLDTIRKRLQCQIRTRTPKKRFESVVALRPVPYSGVVDAGYKIMTEERSRKKSDKHKKTAGWSLHSLYRGFSMQFTSNIILFVLHAVNGIEDDYEDF